jgi:hypothetical protein
MVAGPLAGAVLANAGVAAATVGATMYLPAPPDIADPRHRDLVAHELTHVAARSSRPRFHGGRLDHEERRARTAGHTAARSAPKALESLHVAGLPVAGVVAAAKPKTEIPMAIQRAIRPQPPAPAGPTPVQRVTTASVNLPSANLPSANLPSSETPAPSRPATTTSGRRDDFDALLEALEDRVLADLERRGGRFAGEF